jgi:hypothetical protein
MHRIFIDPIRAWSNETAHVAWIRFAAQGKGFSW